ncbi:MAG TPA: hypothetical protein VES67_22105 [Vicinamibacterales bacterium]|nr:hypothetical protein [Vicinamibacterales bacterium]
MATPPLTLMSDAQRELDRYLRRVNAALRAHPSVDAEEVERDIRGHIAAELADSPALVTEARLRDVLNRLGSPHQWVPTDELPPWRKLLVSIRSASQDWRLAFVTFALFVGGFLTGRLGVVLLLASIPMARATLALLEEEGETLGARRWLVYPPLVVTYVTLLMALFAAPPGLIVTAADPTVREDMRRWFPQPFWVSLPIVVGLVAGLWWAMLGLLAARFVRWARLLFWPFADWFERRHAIHIVRVGFAIAALAAAGLAAVVWAS